MKADVGSVIWNMANGTMADNLADPEFTNSVDALTREIYDDPSTIVQLPLDSLLMLFAIKTFYVDRRHNNPDTIAYIGRLLNSFSRTDSAPEEVRRFRGESEDVASSVNPLYMMDVLLKGETNPRTVMALHRYIADHSLFWAGTFPDASPSTSSFGESCYYTLSRFGDTSSYDREVYSELSRIFPFYVDGMNDLARNFLHAPNREVLTDLMLDAVTRSKEGNLVEATQAKEDALAYARLLHFPSPFGSN
tara:strand:- start:122 stop:868 length:747 start_codon:yes stop_codon:yes gene_type:complete